MTSNAGSSDEKHGGQDGNGGQHQYDRPPNPDRVRAGKRSLWQLTHGSHGRADEHHPCATTDKAQHHTFRQHLPSEPHPACTERRPDREFPLPPEATRNQQVGNIRAGNQQNQPQRRKQSVENGAHRSGEYLLVGGGMQSVATIRSRKVGSDGIQFMLLLYQAHAGTKLSHNVEEVIAPVL